jgi:hypothetical protein
MGLTAWNGVLIRAQDRRIVTLLAIYQPVVGSVRDTNLSGVGIDLMIATRPKGRHER